MPTCVDPIGLVLGNAVRLTLRWRDEGDDGAPSRPEDLTGYDLEIWDVSPALLPLVTAELTSGPEGRGYLHFASRRDVPVNELLTLRVGLRPPSSTEAQRLAWPELGFVFL